MKTVTTDQMREIEAAATRDFNISELVMMENAGRSVADAAESVFRSKNILKDKTICIFCGTGNNGGDGMVAARHLNNRGYFPIIIMVRDPSTLCGNPFTNYIAALRGDIPAVFFEPEFDMDDCGLIIDSLLGTGTKGGIREPYLSAIEFINNSKLPVIAVDIPSGIDADSGEVLMAAVKADVTVTMGAVKRGLTAKQAEKYTGEIFTADIGIPRTLLP